MKAILGIGMLIGAILAGSEAMTLKTQLISSTAGLALFAGCAWLLVDKLRRE